MRDRLLVEYFTTAAWALHEGTLRSLAMVIGRHVAGLRLTSAQIQQVVMEGAASRGSREAYVDEQQAEPRIGCYEVVDGIAVIPVHGVIAKHASQVNGVSQPEGTSCEAIEACLDGALSNTSVGGILLNVHSPGGSVDGIADLSDAVFEAGQHKPVIAHCNELMCSAAYWFSSQASAIYLNETAVIGSIGVYSVLADMERFYNEELLTSIHVVKYGEHKGDFEPGTAISDEQLQEAQRLVDSSAEVFIAHVARGLDIPVKAARELADGRVHVGAEAIEIGLADGVQSFRKTLAAMIEEWGNPGGVRSSLSGSARPVQQRSSSTSSNGRRSRVNGRNHQEHQP